jgi:hypothetical protein
MVAKAKAKTPRGLPSRSASARHESPVDRSRVGSRSDTLRFDDVYTYAFTGWSPDLLGGRTGIDSGDRS